MLMVGATDLFTDRGKVTEVAEVAQGERPAGEGEVRRTIHIAPRSMDLAALPLNTKLVPLYNMTRHTFPSGEARSP